MKINNLIINIILTIVFVLAMYFVFQLISKMGLEDNKASLVDSENLQSLVLDGDTNEMEKVEIEVLKEGEGDVSKVGDTLTVHYTGTLENGSKFDSSVDRGTPFRFTLGNHSVIEGWEQGMLGMKAGEIRKLHIPYELAYGETGYPPIIPEKANLYFEVELLEIN